MPDARLTPQDLDAIAADYRPDSRVGRLVAECRAAWAERDRAAREQGADAELVASIGRLTLERDGLRKAHDLMSKGLESACEREHDLKQRERRLAAAVREAVTALGEEDYDGERVRRLLRAALDEAEGG